MPSATETIRTSERCVSWITVDLAVVAPTSAPKSKTGDFRIQGKAHANRMAERRDLIPNRNYSPPPSH